MSFAAKTSVPAERTRAEIERLLVKHGATGFFSASDGSSAMVGFAARQRMVRFTMQIPTLTDLPRNRRNVSANDKRDQETRRRWRCLLLAIKAKLESVESGIETFDQAFLANILAPDGQTLGDAIKPSLDEAYKNGKAPNMRRMLMLPEKP